MSDPLARLRGARDAARATLNGRITALKGELQPGALAGRIKQDLNVKARAASAQAIEVANDSRGVLIGTAAVLLLWLARKPLLNALSRLPLPWQGAENPAPPTDNT